MVEFNLLKSDGKLEVFRLKLLDHLLLLLVLGDHVFDFAFKFVVDVNVLA